MSNYRERFFEWVNKQPVYQDMTLQTKEMVLNLVNCWLNNNQAYFHYARINGKDFAKRCATDFCWFIKDEQIADLQHRLKVSDKALELCERHHIGFENPTIKEQVEWRETRIKENTNYFKEQAERELKGE